MASQRGVNRINNFPGIHGPCAETTRYFNARQHNTAHDAVEASLATFASRSHRTWRSVVRGFCNGAPDKTTHRDTSLRSPDIPASHGLIRVSHTGKPHFQAEKQKPRKSENLRGFATI
ncbi:hypothetical protein [Paraburkholderia sp.]|uniref:hypothetical protein n=1 Tax=Paraburkholderia sp. TaxID=1926495 RepID=UPI0025F8D23C|nr:hypothetical protein [Paraburkholderia sp.]